MITSYDQKIAEQVQAQIDSLDRVVVSMSAKVDGLHCDCNIYRIGLCAHHASVRDRIREAIAYLYVALDELKLQ